MEKKKIKIKLGEYCGNEIFAEVYKEQKGAFVSAWNGTLEEKSLINLRKIQSPSLGR